MKSVLDYIEETESTEVRRLLFAAHHFLHEVLPPFTVCTIKWKIPFYKLHKNFCYLNRHSDHITLGFPYGYKLSRLPNILLGEGEHLKQVRYLKIRCIEDLYAETTQQILQEAIILDETFAREKRKRSFRKHF